MKNTNRSIIISLFIALSVVLIERGVMAQEEDYRYSYGTVISVTEEAIELSEYDEATGEENSEVYFIDDDTVFEDFDSIDDVSEGDILEVEYFLKEEKRVARSVFLFEKDMGQDDFDMFMEEQ